MSKTKLIAGPYCHYGVGTIPKGETFEAPERDALVLIALGRAKRAAADAVVPQKSTAVSPVGIRVAIPQEVLRSDPLAIAKIVTAGEGEKLEDDPPQSSPETDSGDEKAEEETPAEQPRQKRKYTRRDMQAEK